jgi:iron complex transport system substrate-binding protein
MTLLLDPTTDSAATRREFIAILAASGMLAACGEDDDAAPTPRTRRVDSSHGPIDIPAEPRRVVAMHDQLVGYAVASLGFERLVAVAARDAQDPAVAIRQLGEVPEGFKHLKPIGTYEEPNLEAIAALEPDLIIGLPYEVDELYGRLKRIAPTVVIDLREGNRPRFARQRDLARVLGVEPQLDARLAQYDQRRRQLESRLAGVEGIAYTYLESFGTGPENNYVIRSHYSPGIMVLEDLGFRPSPTTTDYTEEYSAVSHEVLPRHDADVIFVGLPEESTLDPKIAALLDTTHAGRHNRVFTVSRDVWSLEVAEALFGVLDDVERHLGGLRITPAAQFRGA